MIKRVYLLLPLILFISGCNPLGPNFEGMHNPPIPSKWKASSHGDTRCVVSWWKRFEDKTLNTLIQQAYTQNLDIKSAGVRILQARAILGISEGLRMPQIQKLSAESTITHTNFADIKTANLHFDMGWEIDLWGKYARGVEASKAQLYASVASYDTIISSVLAEVAKSYIIYRTTQERLAYAKRSVMIQQRIVEMTKIQFKSGNVSELDMQQALSQLYSTKSSIYAIKIAQAKAKNALALLLAKEPLYIQKLLSKSYSRYSDANYFISKHKGTLQLKSNYKDLIDLHIIPQAHINAYFKIDANLITKRPDVKMAEYIVRSQNALLGAKMADLYPSFSLLGNIGYNSNNKQGVWINGSDALSVSAGPAFSWDILNYGRIKNQIRLQDAKLQESIINYNKQVLLAVSEVSDALDTYRLTSKELKELKKAISSSIRAFNISILQYNEGLVSYQRLLTSVEKLTLTQDRYASIKGDKALSAIALYKALGGGWQIREGKAYISKELAKKMKERTDWEEYLDSGMIKLPKGLYDE